MIVRTRGDAELTHDIFTRYHHAIADEPREVGGDDLGMDPYQFLIAGLGACTSMTMRMYAKRKKWNLQEIEVRLSHSKSYFDDCDTCENEQRRLDHITKKITITGDLTEEQRQRLLEIAEKCPVNRTLHNEIIIETVD